MEGASLLISLPDRIDEPEMTFVTHLHLLDTVQTADRSFRLAEIKSTYWPKIIVNFMDRRRMIATLERFQRLRFRLGPDDVSPLSATILGNDDTSRQEAADTKFYMLIKDSHDDRAMNDALRHFFVWKGDVPSDDIVTWASPSGIVQQQLLVHHEKCRGWLHKLTVEDGLSQTRILPIATSEDCVLCRPAPSPLSYATVDHEKMIVEEGSYKIPAPRYKSLSLVTASNFIADFAGISGANLFRKVQAPDLVRAFDAFVEINYPDSIYWEKRSALARVTKGFMFA